MTVASNYDPTFGVYCGMSAILQLIEAANAEAERLRHMAQTTKRPNVRRMLERDALEWAYLAATAKTEFGLMK